MIGKLFVIESGTDGSGKATQSELLYNRLESDGYKVKKVEYPNYNSESSSLVKMYLRGDFGKKADDVDPYIASTFFAADRYATYKTEWEDFYMSGGTIIADRYATSNLVHQASKMDDLEEREQFLKWMDDYEYNLYKIPRADSVFFLDVPVDVSSELIKNRKNKITHESEKDIHESDYEYLKKTYENSKYIACKYKWDIINCVDKNKSMRNIEDIHDEIYSKVVNVIKGK
ncbi:dTMP kinase [Peptostreptococcus faecalis]|uniref:dTMP kinase n=1 Tax=Peptostreptococcus faecalis TaxID=2045015 RepID=UPI000C7DF6E8|nr:thymidylate kinase [Peptostreptococcus faecalis]